MTDDPAQAYQGRLGRTLEESTPFWPARAGPPANAPDIVIVEYPLARSSSASVGVSRVISPAR